MRIYALQDSALEEFALAGIALVRRIGIELAQAIVQVYQFAANNMLVVAIIVAIFGILLLRPRHSPR